MAEIVNSGHLLPDKMILRALDDQFHSAAASGVNKFLLDGFPRSVPQAAALEEIADVQLALNLDLREEVLVQKCMGRRICSKCGKNYNVADINLAAGNGRPAIIMPPLSPPPECAPFMEQRSDDTQETILKRLEVYNSGAKPVEDFYRKRGTLVDFEITAGIPETLPGLLELLGGHVPSIAVGSERAAAA
jgi:adenylate kinase